MANPDHPFHAIAALAASRGSKNITLMSERDGAYLRLLSAKPPVFFKYGPDAGDPIDRSSLDHCKRLTLSEADCEFGPEDTLALVERLLEKFADYVSPRSQNNPTSGRDK